MRISRMNGLAISFGVIVACSWAIAAENSAPGVAAAQDLLACQRAAAQDPRIASIKGKLPLEDVNAISFNMLADESKPTPLEREEIAEWFDQREQCWKTRESELRSQWPPELIQLSEEGSAGIKSIGVDLYNRKLTYGEANKRIEELGNSIKARVIPIVKQYQTEIAAQNAATAQQEEQRRDAADRRVAQQQSYADAQANQAEALRLQRAQLFLNYMRANQPPKQLPQLTPYITTNCQSYGSTTNCVTR